MAISYAAIAGEPATTFDDLVEYNKRTDAVGKAPSRIKGVDRLEPGAGARWKWSVSRLDPGNRADGPGAARACS